ncbi:hypothetical protein RJ641_027585 [Dillenia turbinata]|uniref:Uncharacterized protein n=1 Tax=Dillenia turbinata TaxID=194707 RepID=A0AAN8W943_9MAGN
MILAAERTRRKDPLNYFKHYTGGWNISDKHYWASIGLTAGPFFVIAIVWFLVFGLSLFFICLCYCFRRREPYGYSRLANILALISLGLFTVAAITGCIVLYTGQGKFHSSTTGTLNYVVKQAHKTFENLQDVSYYLSSAKLVGICQIVLPPNVRNSIDKIDAKIYSSSNSLRAKTSKNAHKILKVFDNEGITYCSCCCNAPFGIPWIFVLRLWTAVSGILFASSSNQVCGVCPLQLGDPWLDSRGWDIYFEWRVSYSQYVSFDDGKSLCRYPGLKIEGNLNDNRESSAVADTCIAMEEWVQNPTAQTVVNDILPCLDNATAEFVMLQSKRVTSLVVDVVNGLITNFLNLNATLPPDVSFNPSGPLMPTLCNPFNADLTRRQCEVGEVTFKIASQVWKSYQCEVSSSGICVTQGRVTPALYNQLTAIVNVTYALHYYSPFLVRLVDCTFVRDTFTHIGKNYCPSLKKYSERIYIGLMMVSAAVMCSLILWVIYGRGVYTKQHMARKKS